MSLVNKSSSDVNGIPFCITTAGTYEIKKGHGHILRVIFASASDQEIILLDGAMEIAHFVSKDIIRSFEVNASFHDGLTAITGFDFDVTIIYI